mgnify:CR=1 FL=1
MVFFLEIEFLNFSSIIGITEEMREEYRQRVLDTTKEVFFFKIYLIQFIRNWLMQQINIYWIKSKKAKQVKLYLVHKVMI